MVTVDLTIQATSFAEPRTLEIYYLGQQRTKVMVDTALTTITISDVLLAPGATDFIFVATPGSRVVDPVLHNGDLRSLSVLFFNPRIVVQPLKLPVGWHFSNSLPIERARTK